MTLMQNNTGWINAGRVILPLLVVVVLAITALLMVGILGQDVAQDISHASSRHGSDAEIARQCSGSAGMHLFHNPTTNRFGTVCEIDGAWGIVISDEAGNEITAFLKNKMVRFDQVVKYMRNQGYGLVH